jgi:hypothetical protein
MTANFKFDKRAMEKVVNDGMREAGKETQAVFDRVHRSHAAKPVDVVLAHLRSAARLLPIKLNETALREYAKSISEGTRIVFDVKKARL